MARGRPTRKTVYARLDALITELHERLGGLPQRGEAEYVWRDIWHLEAHHSTALEGNTLVLREVELLLEKGRAVGAKPMREYLEVKGYADAAEWAYSQALEPGDWAPDGLISIAEIREIHRRVMTPVWTVEPHPDASAREGPGLFREHEIAPFDGGMMPPTWPIVPSELHLWVEQIQALVSDESRPLAERIAEAHNRFECIHPFIDGNGRVGRIVLNMVLVRLGYPPVIILKQQRPAYLAAMEQADRGEFGALAELLARAMIDNLNRFVLPSVAGPARLVPIASLADDRISQVALRLAAQRGRLDAVRGGDGLWRSSRRAVDGYLASRFQRGAE